MVTGESPLLVSVCHSITSSVSLLIAFRGNFTAVLPSSDVLMSKIAVDMRLSLGHSDAHAL
jgi:hypothetical protein